ncbi:hypothetical protein RclHR1_39210001 [Rhizophagus clarus]|uniref:Uncharacterized protein n=1 Tax=Rhizophagus clarus TaxID=94130 RepID=A0A2Z6RDJ0_9GLOM|nr:hypothetical protein RclHR1_39210001 [Rhizophagus clarus]
MAYIFTDLTGVLPAHLVAMDINQLINVLKNDANALLVNGRMTITSNLININHKIKHIIGLIIAHDIQIEERARQTREKLDTSTGLLKYLQEVTNAREQKSSGSDQANQLQDQQVRQRKIRDTLQQRNNRLTHQLAIERLTSRNLGRIRDRMQAQLAALRIQMQWFQIRQVGPIVNNPHLDNPQLYKGYIHNIGIDPSAVAGDPAGWEKAMVKLRNILLRAAHGDEMAFKALADNAANCPVNTWVNPSGARNIMAPGGVGANVLVTNV